MISEMRNIDKRIYARYWIETAFPLEDAAATMAGEQSTGTFVRVPGETDELRERYAARVEKIEELGTVDAPSLPGSGLPKKHSGPVVRRTAEVDSFVADRKHGPIAAESSRHGRGKSLRVEAILRSQTSRRHAAAGVSYRVPGPAIRRRGHAAPHRRLRPAGDRHHHQTQRWHDAASKPRHK